jgi:hypothetical protein
VENNDRYSAFLIIVYLTVKSLFGSLSQKETLLEKQLKQEIEEVKKLKEQLKKRD